MRKKNRGFILIEALMIIIVLVALMAMIAADQRAAGQQIQNQLRRRRADAAARSAVAFAMGAVQQVNVNLVSTNDAWYQLDDSGDYAYTLGDADFRVQVVDCASLINVNTASTQWLQQLPLTTDQVDCLLDWRETGTEPRADGAKDSYYNGLSQPYNTKLGPLSTVDELLLVKGWTGHDLYVPSTTTSSSAPLPADDNGQTLPLASILTVDSGSPNVQADGSARINLSQGGGNLANQLRNIGINGNLAAQIAQRAPYTTFQQLFTRVQVSPGDEQRLLNAVSFSTDTRNTGKINLNTASQAVLLTIPNMTQAIAGTIINQQSSGFTTLGQLATSAGLTPQQIPDLADYFSVGSDTFLVRAYGESGGVGSALEVVIRVTNGTPQVVTWTKLSSAGIPAWWDWSETAASSSDAATLTNTSTTMTTTTGGG